MFGQETPHMIHATLWRKSQKLFNEHAIRPACLVMAMYAHCPPPKLSLTTGGSGPPANTWLLGPTPLHTPNSISIEPADSSGLMLDYPYTLLWDASSHPKIDHSMTIRTPSNTWLLWPTPPHMPNGISIGPAVFSGHLSVTGHTDRHKMQNKKSCLKCK